ncbi:ribbon-helix-helix protein, CopG family [Ralstonia pseudosolanacearum]
MSEKNPEVLTVEVTKKLKEDLKGRAQSEGVSVSDLVRRILKGYFERQRNKKSS